jgi:hypothetical protein
MRRRAQPRQGRQNSPELCSTTRRGHSDYITEIARTRGKVARNAYRDEGAVARSPISIKTKTANTASGAWAADNN